MKVHIPLAEMDDDTLNAWERKAAENVRYVEDDLQRARNLWRDIRIEHRRRGREPVTDG